MMVSCITSIPIRKQFKWLLSQNVPAQAPSMDLEQIESSTKLLEFACIHTHVYFHDKYVSISKKMVFLDHKIGYPTCPEKKL